MSRGWFSFLILLNVEDDRDHDHEFRACGDDDVDGSNSTSGHLVLTSSVSSFS